MIDEANYDYDYYTALDDALGANYEVGEDLLKIMRRNHAAETKRRTMNEHEHEETPLGFSTPVDPSLDPKITELWKDKPRPSGSHREVLRKHFTEEEVRDLSDLFRVNGVEELRELRDDLIKNYSHDGFKYGKNMEDDGWPVDALTVDTLDGICTRSALDECVKEWAKANRITYKYKAGQTVRFTWGFAQQVGKIESRLDNYTYLMEPLEGRSGNPMVKQEDIKWAVGPDGFIDCDNCDEPTA